MIKKVKIGNLEVDQKDMIKGKLWEEKVGPDREVKNKEGTDLKKIIQKDIIEAKAVQDISIKEAKETNQRKKINVKKINQ